jgi:glycosyltransferase involved in cell wall biosynthesis
VKILIASQDWDYRFARPQHFARILSEQHRVTYLSTGPAIRERTIDCLRHRAPWRLPSYRVNANLQVFSALYPAGHGTAPGMERDCRFNAMLARRLFPRAFAQADIGITTNPVHYDTIANLKWRRLVYDCLDRYEGFFPAGSELYEFVREREQRLMRDADFVFVSARQLYEDKVQQRRVFYLPHGVPVEHFQNRTLPFPPELKDVPRPIVGFLGGIEHWVNLEWLARAAREFRDASLVLVGDVRADTEVLAGLPNVRFLGYRRYDDVPRYVAAFDVCVIPFQINELTAGVNPIKVLEYMALGKPVIASYMPELEQYVPHVTLARTADEFTAGIARADRSPDAAQARIALASQRSWRRVAESFLRVVTGRAEDTGFQVAGR